MTTYIFLLALGVLLGRLSKPTRVIRYDLTDYDGINGYFVRGASCEDEARVAVLRQRAKVLDSECRGK